MVDENHGVGQNSIAMERRDRFRRQLERLEGAGGPQQAIDAGFYVERPRASERLLRRIELKPRATRVITGPIGSGKSTELMILAEALNRLPDVWAVVIDVSLVHDLSDLQEGSLIAAAGVWLQTYTGVDSSALRAVREIAYGTTKTFGSLAMDWVTKVEPEAQVRSVRGVLQAPDAQARITWALAEKLKHAVVELIPDAARGTPILMFDSLDRVRDSDGFRTVLERDAAALHDHGFGVILTAPVTTLWSHSGELRSLCESWDTLPYVDPTKDETARTFLMEVLERRLDPAILGPEQRSTLLRASGGVLRDLIELARNAVEEAYMNGRDAVSDADTTASIVRFARGLSLGLSGSEIGLLRSVQTEQQIRTLDETTLQLLENRQILEHHDPASGSYFEPHPALQSVLARRA